MRSALSSTPAAARVGRRGMFLEAVTQVAAERTTSLARPRRSNDLFARALTRGRLPLRPAQEEFCLLEFDGQTGLLASMTASGGSFWGLMSVVAAGPLCDAEFRPP